MIVYNMSTNTWSTTTAYNASLGGIGIVAVETNIYTIGGTTAGGTHTNKCFKFDTLTNTYSALADAIELVSQCGVVYYDGEIFIFGGTNAAGSYVPAIRKYTIATNSWGTLSTTVPTPLPKTAAYYDNVHMSVGWDQHVRYNITSQTLTTGLITHSQYTPFVS